MTTSELELILREGRVIDPAQGIDGVMDVGILGGRVAAVAPALAATPRTKMINVRGKLVLPGLIDTHAHIYEHVTGIFGLNADLVGIRSGVTTVVDQGGASPLTFNGFRNFVARPAKSRVLSFISIYLAGGLMGHSHAGLYGPHGIDVGATVRAIEENRDLVKGIKTHAEIGGYSRWGIEVLKLAKEASRRARVPV
jgi:dihydroorotase